MSNALPILLAAASPATQPAPRPDYTMSPTLTSLCGLGVCVFLIWLARNINNPSKVKLSVSPGRRNSLTPIHALALWFFSLILTRLTAEAALLCFDPKSIQATAISLAAPSLLFLTGGLVMAKFCFDGGVAGGMGFTARRWFSDSVRGCIAFLAVMPICMLLLAATLWVMLQLDLKAGLVTQHPILTLLTSPNQPLFWRAVLILTAVIAAPLGEEVLFRGILQSTIRRYTHKPWIAILTTSLLFAAAHCEADIKSLPALFALSIALGYNYERTGRLFAPIVIHILFNAANIMEFLSRH